MDRARPGTGFGINPIAWQEIDAWARQRKLVLSQWEIDALISLDSVRMELFYASKSDGENNDKPQVSERPLTSRLFDALFPGKRR